MNRLLLVGAVVVLVACSGTVGAQPKAAAEAIPSGAVAVTGGCGATQLYQGTVPAWSRMASAPVGSRSRYAMANPAIAVALLSYPLRAGIRAGTPDDPANKVPWFVRYPNRGSLSIKARPLRGTEPLITIAGYPANPGYVFTSILDVPTPGCWHFDLGWDGHHGELDLLYT